MKPLMIAKARLADPSQDYDGPASLLIADGKIEAVEKSASRIEAPEGAEILNARENLVIPGLVDMRVHLGEPGSEYRETIASASQAAACGGVTGFVMMPDTSPVIDEVSLVDYVRRAARDNAQVHVYPSAAITRGFEGRELTEFGLLREAGAVMLSEGKHSIRSALTLRRALTYARDFGLLIAKETQDRDLASNGVMNEGLTATHLGLAGIPREAEIIALERDLRIAQLSGGRYHAAKISTSDAAGAIARCKQAGADVSAGVSINHLSLNENDIGRYRTFFRLSPPLRAEEDRQAMVAALRDGLIDVIVSSHDPQDVDTKRHPFAEAADGAIGLETLLAAALRLHHNGDVPLLRLIDAMSTRPAQLLGLEAGSLKAGMPADLALVDCDAPWIYGEDQIRSLSKNTPFEGARFSGRVLQTLVGGRTIFTHNA
ncbi:dihydroorotase [Salaquimonas pukyongi]|uniref:dihydroorotase n=1 Tax=Salaquimonas pukyongi TaxID=2712698 RepID=UPI00096BA5F2|nr:dihydroorotase [Salaquimonas pukyongi]